MRRILNWGGFVTSSFRVGDGERTAHLKLGRSPEQTQMRRWLTVHERLERCYRAPRILEWVEIPGADHAGLLFEHIDGSNWDIDSRPDLMNEIVGLLATLHGDGELVRALGDPARTYRDCWELRYRELFEEHLKAVRGCRPSFVSNELLEWMERESEKVIAIGREHWAFGGVSRSACHLDLWHDNVMLDKSGDWWILDWDGLAVGDPAEDYATLLWPFVHRRGTDWRNVLGANVDAAFEARMELHMRAITLDYVVDPLADWVECDVPEWMDKVRARKQREHVECLDLYRRKWG
ncbi:MAG TPA: aminoglycoside phosphotransferase family protein [Bryobacteraceae bacterium]